jgi:ketosteroid isomerase-like protein
MFVLKITIREGTPLSGEFRGKDAVSNYFNNILPKVARFEQQVPPEYISDGNRAIVLGDDLYTVHKTGQSFCSPYAWVVVFAGEQISNILGIQDLWGIASAYSYP